ncbi:hypothetical protein LTR28_011217 [Elasticomyces elasticus]|nr:hypothetical protein LTR28_011217 [Elasticomyces elasticus]
MANDYMVEMVDRSLSELAESGCITIHTNGDIDPTPLGKIMSYYYLSHKTIRELVSHAKPDASFEEVLSWMCRATEYDELPVRHNEDLINAELSNNLPLKADALGLPMWDPHVKAFLLLQAHFSRIDLPISDYVGDQNSVLDQSIRIVQASIDVLTELGFLKSCDMMMKLLQCVKSARWPDDGPLAILPQVEVLAEQRRMADPQAKIRTLVAATTAARHEMENVLKQIDVPPAIQPRAFKALAALPQLRVNVVDVTALGLTVGLARLNPTQDAGYKMYAPRFPKPQTEGFFVIVSDPAKDEIVALKRVGWPSREGMKGPDRGKPTARASIKLPESHVERKLDVVVISDGYIDTRWKIEGVEIPKPPEVVDVGAKKL